MRRKKRKPPVPVEGSQRRKLIQAIDAYESNPTGPAAHLLLKRIRATVSAMQEPDPPLILKSIDRLRKADTAGGADDTIELLQGKVEGLMPLQPREPGPDPEQPAIPEQEPAITRQPAEAPEPEPVLPIQEFVQPPEPLPVEIPESAEAPEPEPIVPSRELVEAPIPILSTQEQARLNQELIDAVYDRNVGQARGLLEAGAEVDTWTPSEGPVLIAAAGFDDAAMVDLLISYGADVEARGPFEMTALMRAASRGHTEVMKLLIPRSLDLDAKDKYGSTALCHAVSAREHWMSQKQMEAADLLLSAGADINAGDFTPLMHTIIGDNRVLFDFLLSREADVNARGFRGTTPLIVASEHGKTDYMDELISREAEVNATDDLGRTPLMHAVWDGQYDAVKLLFLRGADIDAETGDGETALKIAYAHAGLGNEGSPQRIAYANIIDFLKPHSEKDKVRHKKLRLVVRNPDQADVVSGVTIGLTDRIENLAPQEQSEFEIELCKAAYEGELNRAYNLLECGVSANAKDAKNIPALSFALDHSRLETAELLIRRGATVTPELQEKLNHSLRAAAYDGEIERIEKLIALGADVKGMDSRGCSPLYFASQNGHYDAVKLLLENEADPNVASTAGITPFMAALRNGHYKIAKLLKEHGAEGPSIWLYRLREKSHLIFLSLIFVAALGIGGYAIHQIKRIRDIRNARQAVQALYREKGSPALIRVLEREDRYVRAQAASLLGEKKEKSAFRPLIKALADEEEHVQDTAAWAIGHIVRKHPSVNALPAIPSLIKILKGDNEELWTNSSFALAGISAKNPRSPELRGVIPLLVERANAEEIKVRKNVAWILSEMAKKSGQNAPELQIAIPSLIKMLEGDDEGLWTNSSFTLGEILVRNPRNPDLLKTIPLLVERTNAKESKDRLNVSWMLSHIAKEGPQNNPELLIAIPSLIGRLGDSDLGVRNNAAWALGNIAKNTRNRIRMEPATMPLKRLLSDPKTKDSAKSALEKINELP